MSSEKCLAWVARSSWMAFHSLKQLPVWFLCAHLGTPSTRMVSSQHSLQVSYQGPELPIYLIINKANDIHRVHCIAYRTKQAQSQM